ncbi:hypothetical protein E4U43_006387 [Claviceps pusilla]|uniref:Uncharacterized protein n=1 Tax=Claviceps pusilla TaxID=123648 RepID=A0A9P7NJA1_9HYPO|nr:hypothetical protein E4U43_006387 [Claviceps pusilla]
METPPNKIPSSSPASKTADMTDALLQLWPNTIHPHGCMRLPIFGQHGCHDGVRTPPGLT